MKRLRHLLRDRICGGVAAASLSYVLLVQLFVAALSCGLTVPAIAGDEWVLCEPAVHHDAAGEDRTAFAHDCPCAVCNSAEGDLDLLPGDGKDLGVIFGLAGKDEGLFAAWTDALPAHPAALGLSPLSHAPPLPL